jgi:N6-adenosine-specific RNA methylase IME4
VSDATKCLKAKFILADPNWEYRNMRTKQSGAAKAHYTCLDESALSEIPVGMWADEDCVLYLYATWPKLTVAFSVAEAWGFPEESYVTGYPWIKVSPSSGDVRTGIGFWAQSTSELVLIFRRGKAKSPGGGASKRGEKRDNVLGLLCGSKRQFYAPIKEHSAKPLMVYDWAKAKLQGPYLELFARNSIFGWNCWGHDTGYHLHPGGVCSVEEAIAAGMLKREDVGTKKPAPAKRRQARAR